MLTCREIQEEVPAYLAGFLSKEQQEEVERHLTGCPTCTAEVSDVSRVWRCLDTQPQGEPSARAVARISQLIREDLEQEKQERRERQWEFSGREVAWTVTGGLLFALSSVGVLAGGVELTPLSAPLLIGSGSLWTALYILAFALYLRPEPTVGASLNLRVIAFAALLTVPFSLAEDYFFSINTLVQEYVLSWSGATAFTLETLKGAYFGVSALYALAPMFMVSFVLRNEVAHFPLRHGLACGGLFFLLTLPAVHLQGGSLPMSVELSWMGGECLGAVIGASLGFGFRPRMVIE